MPDSIPNTLNVKILVSPRYSANGRKNSNANSSADRKKKMDCNLCDITLRFNLGAKIRFYHQTPALKKNSEWKSIEKPRNIWFFIRKNCHFKKKVYLCATFGRLFTLYELTKLSQRIILYQDNYSIRNSQVHYLCITFLNFKRSR